MTLLGMLFSLATAIEGGISLWVIVLLVRRIEALQTRDITDLDEAEVTDGEWWG